MAISPQLIALGIPLALQALRGSSESSENGTGLPGLEGLLQAFAQSQEETIEALFADGANGGTATDRSGAATVGVLEIMVIPPTAQDPMPRLRWKTNGPVIGTPAQVKRVAARFVQLAEDLEMLEAFEQAKELVPEAVLAQKKEQQRESIGAVISQLPDIG